MFNIESDWISPVVKLTNCQQSNVILLFSCQKITLLAKHSSWSTMIISKIICCTVVCWWFDFVFTNIIKCLTACLYGVPFLKNLTQVYDLEILHHRCLSGNFAKYFVTAFIYALLHFYLGSYPRTLSRFLKDHQFQWQ